MESSSTVTTLGVGLARESLREIARTYSAGGLDAVARQQGLVLVTLVLAAIVLILFILVLFMPAKRKVLVKRRVRVARRVIDPSDSAARAVPTATESAADPLRRRKALTVPTVAAAVVLLAFIAAYVVTGSNRYCALSCHAKAPGVTTAFERPHADCVDCHEAGPLSAVVVRTRMLAVYAVSGASNTSPVPVDPSRCLRCHKTILRENVVRSRVRMSHEAVISGGFTCSDCHEGTGHSRAVSSEGRMDRCVPCHDGKRAANKCATCHVGGSPLARRRTVETARMTYNPVQVANRDCTKCHGLNKRCMDCHNGLLMPHPEAFRTGGHAKLAAFDRKERCYKCHSLAWCSRKCHHDFSAHDEKEWRKGHQNGTSAQCGSCHIAWDGKGNWCDVCH